MLDLAARDSPWQLHLGDCIEGMRALPDKSVDHTIIDPPFEQEAHSKGRRVKQGRARLAFVQLALGLSPRAVAMCCHDRQQRKCTRRAPVLLEAVRHDAVAA